MLNYSKIIEETKKEILMSMLSENIVGLGLSFIDGDDIIWREGYGLYDKEGKQKTDLNTTYRFSSLTKLFTATAVLLQQEHGLLDIKKPLSYYVPEFVIKDLYETPETITLESLLTHSSGIPGNILAFENPDLNYNTRSFFEFLRYEYRAYPSNFIVSYSNIGYILLGYVIEKTSGLTYEQFITKNLLEPLDMKRTGFNASLVYPKSYNFKGEFVYEEPSFFSSSGMTSNVMDFTNFMMMVNNKGVFNGKRIISPQYLNEMINPHSNKNKLNDYLSIGYGFWIYEKPYGKNIGHEGDQKYSHVSYISNPELKLGFLICGNSEKSYPTIEKIAEKFMNKAVELKTGKVYNYSSTNQPNVIVPVSQKEISEYTGIYLIEDLVVKVFGQNEKLYFNVNGQNVEFVKNDDGYFYSTRANDFYVKFSDIDSHKILTYYPLKKNLLRYENNKFDSTWIKILGVYKTTNIEEEIEFLIDDDGILYLEYKIWSVKKRFAARVLNDNQIIIHGIGKYMNEILTFSIDRDILHYSGLIFYKIKK